MAYASRLMTPVRDRAPWARPAHSIDSAWAYGSLNTHFTVPTNNVVWPSANLIIYVPVIVKEMVRVKKLAFGSGTTGTGNIAIGVYSRAGARLINSGTIAKGTTNVPQVVDTTDTVLKPDLYYIALQGSNGTDTFSRSSTTAPILALDGVRSEAAAFGLPATATWTVDQTLAFCPVVEMLTETTLA